MSRRIFQHVADHKNCEDIAISFMISSLTGGQRPLLSDQWSRWPEVVLGTNNAISDTFGHKRTRSTCIQFFAQVLGLQDVEGGRYLAMGPVDTMDNVQEVNYTATTNTSTIVFNEDGNHTPTPATGRSLHPREHAVRRIVQSLQNENSMQQRRMIKFYAEDLKNGAKGLLKQWKESAEGMFP